MDVHFCIYSLIKEQCMVFIVSVVRIFKHQLKQNTIMGLLSDLGPIQGFQEMMSKMPIIKRKGLIQFLQCLKKYASWTKPSQIQEIKWGQEIQGNFLKADSNGGLQLCKQNINKEYEDLQFPLMYQYGSYMFQMIPSAPYATRCNFYEIIDQIRLKYKILQGKERIALTIPVIPFIGLDKNYSTKPFNNQITKSDYISDDYISSHPRFATLTRHIRLRRGSKVQMFVPVFQDYNTSKEQMRESGQPKDGYIYLDAMAFGMGLCCLQCTFSTKSLPHARYLYDQLNVISPIFLALTAGSPFHKGKLADWDARWNIISGSVDDRTENERNPSHPSYLPFSRYGMAAYYLSDDQSNLPQYNDFDVGVKSEDVAKIMEFAAERGVVIDKRLAFHVASIFKRDLLIIYEKFEQMKDNDNMIFDMLNGTNWNSMRLKIPIDDQIGWRVEFRTMEVQLTPDQNSAYSLLIHFITRVLHQSTDLNFYIPISLLKENFDRSIQRDAVLKQKFYFRTNIYDKGEPVIDELSCFEILFGKGDFKGLFHEVEIRFSECTKACQRVDVLLKSIKQFVMDTATGKRLTLAQWMRKYIDSHPKYQHNSILPKEVMDDLLWRLYRISTGQIKDINFPIIFQEWVGVESHDKQKLSDMKCKIDTEQIMVSTKV